MVAFALSASLDAVADGDGDAAGCGGGDADFADDVNWLGEPCETGVVDCDDSGDVDFLPNKCA